ncbi:Ubiquitin carboxyl-terminal hydrolase 17-like protein E [Lemmus lemmus]
MSWERFHGVGAGLQNTGNSCYLNAALQCLTHTPPLANYMLSREHSQSCSHQGGCPMCAMEAHVTQSFRYSGEVMQPSKKLTGAFHKHKQEDAHEFLMFTLNAMHESCLRGSTHSEAPSENSTPIRAIFGGSWRSQIKCLHCQATSDSFNSFLDIPLDIQAAQSVKQALGDLVMAEELCGENAYHCDHCQGKTTASKTLTIQTAPKVLLLVLNRFSDFTGDKVDRKVSYPESLDLRPYMTQPNSGPSLYVLCAVLVHAGLTCHRGHYFCYVRAGNGKWYKMDDSNVARCDVTSVLSEPAYVLFYVRETDLEKDSIIGPVGTVGQGQQRKLNRGSCVGAAESRRPVESAAAKEISLDQWNALQGHNRPKPALNLRKIESTLPVGLFAFSSLNTKFSLVSSCCPKPASNESQVAAELTARGKPRMSWERFQGVGAGLQNTGNSCYLNAALQCLKHTPPLANYMLSREHSQSCSHQGGCPMCAMEAHVTQSFRYSGEVMQPSKKLTGAFHKHKQEDAHEFLMFTLNAMHESCLRGSTHSEAPSENSTPIRAIFGGSWRSQIKCLHCQATSDSFNSFLDIPLDIQAAQSVKQALGDLVMAEELCGENAYHCDYCQGKTTASKTLTIQTAPKVLLLVLNRFSDFTGDKVDRKVSYPESLDLRPYMTQPNSGPSLYVLCAVLVHAGLTCHRGHYFCYVRAGNGKWYKMDDSNVARCDVTSVLSEPAYVLFYVRETDLEKDSIIGPVGTVGQGQQRKLNRGSCVGAAESRRPVESAAAKEISLDQWNALQGHNRPKPALNLRKIESTLPVGAVVIHQPRHRGHWDTNGPNKENYPLHSSARFLPAQRAMSSQSSQGGRSRAKNKQRWRPLVV